MSENCSHNCSECGESCSSRTAPQSFLADPHPMASVKKVIGVVSGKGGVGKSLVTSMLSVLMQRKGFSAGILDADITGPSIPKVFGITEKAKAIETGILPTITKTGISMMSLNLLLENVTDPVVWRGPVIAGTVKQFWTDVIWEDVDYLFVDMPPGTGDVPLTVFQSLPIDGIVVVTSPQELVGMIVEKAMRMANMMNIPVLGIVENMSYFECPDCGGKHAIFGESHVEALAASYGLDTFSRIPMSPVIASLCDKGDIESFTGDYLDNMAAKIEASVPVK